MYTYRLRTLVFNDGTKVEPGRITVIVGPNNSGKSQALKDIASRTTRRKPPPCVVVKEVEWTMPSSLDELLGAYSVDRHRGEHHWEYRTLAPNLCQEHAVSGGDWPNGYESMFRKTSDSLRGFAEHFGTSLVGLLTTEHRLRLVAKSESPTGFEIHSLLHALYRQERAAEATIRTVVKEAFGEEIVLDITALRSIQLRVGTDLGDIPPDPRDARPPMEQLSRLDDEGDGIRSFVGIVAAILVANGPSFLLTSQRLFFILHRPSNG